MPLSLLKVRAQVLKPCSNSSGFRSINLSLSLESHRTCPCTPPHDTSRRRSWGCWRAACTGGGARWRTTPGVHTHKHMNIFTHTYAAITLSDMIKADVHTFRQLLLLCISWSVWAFLQICRLVYPGSTGLLSSCILTSPWCRWESHTYITIQFIH